MTTAGGVGSPSLLCWTSAVDADADAADPLAAASLGLAGLAGAAVQGRLALGPRAGARVKRLGHDPDAPWVESSRPRRGRPTWPRRARRRRRRPVCRVPRRPNPTAGIARRRTRRRQLRCDRRAGGGPICSSAFLGMLLTPSRSEGQQQAGVAVGAFSSPLARSVPNRPFIPAISALTEGTRPPAPKTGAKRVASSSACDRSTSSGGGARSRVPRSAAVGLFGVDSTTHAPSATGVPSVTASRTPPPVPHPCRARANHPRLPFADRPIGERPSACPVAGKNVSLPCRGIGPPMSSLRPLSYERTCFTVSSLAASTKARRAGVLCARLVKYRKKPGTVGA